MAFTVDSFNNDATPDFVYTYKAATTTYSANKNGTAVYDYFADDFGVGDFVIWGGPGGRHAMFNGIKVNVGTAIAATSYTLVWQYSTGVGSWSTLTVTDPTSNFSITGAATITFTPPLDWTSGRPSGEGTFPNFEGFVVRCRVTAVTTPTEGGANQTTANKVGDNFLNLSGSGAFLDLYNAASSQGITTIYKDATNTLFEFNNFHLKLATSAVLSDTGKTVYIRNQQWGANFVGTITLGTTYTDLDGVTRGTNGCALYRYENANGAHSCSFNAMKLNLYASLYYETRSGWEDFTDSGNPASNWLDSVVVFNLKNCNIPRGNSASSLNFKRTTIIFNGGAWDLWANTATIVMTDMFVKGTIRMRMEVNSGTWTLTRWKISGTLTLSPTRTPVTVRLDNTNYTTLSISGSQTWNVINIQTRWTFDLKVVDANNTAISGATVVGTYQEGTAAFSVTTDASGDITQQTVYEKIRVYTNSPSSDVTTNYGTPLTVTIKKPGYASRVVKYTMTEAREEVEMLARQKIQIDQETL